MAENGIKLGDLIFNTSQEIRRARDESKKIGDPVLNLQSCQLELKVILSAEAGGGIKICLLDFSAKGSAQNASTITLMFGPADSRPSVFLAAKEDTSSIAPAKKADVVKEELKDGN